MRILKECNAGIKMGVDSIEGVVDHVNDSDFKKILTDNKDEHQRLGSEIHQLLNRYNERGKDPDPMAKGMSWMKTNLKITMNDNDHTVADLITDGCNMGVKSLSRYLNQYQAADEEAKYIAKKLIHLEEQLAKDIRSYL